MRVAVFPADDSGCGWYRIRWVAQALIEAGEDIVVRDRVGRFIGKRLDGELRPWKLVEEPDFDVAVLQRPISRDLADAVQMLQRSGVSVVVEMDDDLARLTPQHPAYVDHHPTYSPASNWAHAARACTEADLVTVSTPALATRYGAHGRVAILRNRIPSRWLQLERPENDRVVVGWTGAFECHPGDLEVTRGGVARGLSGALFRCVDSPEIADKLCVPAADTDVRSWAPLHDGYPELVASLDIGIAPLAATAFNAGKSALRGIEYAAAGVPFVASPTSEYVRLNKLGLGRLAERPRDWTREVSRLVASTTLREEIAGQGRVLVAGETIEANAFRWLEAWHSAVDRRAHRLGVGPSGRGKSSASTVP